MAVARAGAACPTAAAAWKKAAISSKVVSGAMRAPVASSSAWMRSMMSLAGWSPRGKQRCRAQENRIQNPESRIQMGGCRTRSDESAGIQNSESRIQNPNGGLSDAICTRAKTLRISSAGIQNSESRIQNPKGGLSDAICTFWRTLEYRNTEYRIF